MTSDQENKTTNPDQNTAEEQTKVEDIAPENDDKIEDIPPTWEEQYNTLNDKFLRVAAELQNTQRRAAKEKRDLIMFGNEKLVQDFLPVLDAFEKALSNKEAAGEQAGVWQGVELIHEQLTKTLEKHGLQKITSLHTAFDPQLHQAIQKIEKNDVKEDTVIQEFASGYTLNGRLVRAAMVQVGTPISES